MRVFRWTIASATRLIASCAVRLGRYPNDPGWKSASKTGSSMSLSAPCTTLSRIAGIERTRTLPPSFGISCLRAGSGCDGRPLRSSRNCSSKASTPCASLASKVTPSIPGAPSFLLAISYAARKVSILQTWTYSPQTRQDGSAFALTYILRLRSCKSMDAFVISSLPSPMLETLQMAGPPSLRGHCSASSLLQTQPPPSRRRPTSRFRRLYGLPCSDDFAPGRGGLLQLLGMSLSPCCRFHPAEVNIRIGQSSAAHAAFALRLKARPSGILIFEATTRSLLLRPGDSWPPLGRPCR